MPGSARSGRIFGRDRVPASALEVVPDQAGGSIQVEVHEEQVEVDSPIVADGYDSGRPGNDDSASAA